MKRCFKCGVEKPLESFYAHRMMADGHLGKCIDCAKRDVCRRRIMKRDDIRAYDRERAKRPDTKARIKRISEAWAREYPERRRAQALLKRAVSKGQIVKPSECEGCSREVRVEGHHHDYSKPLIVAWLCKPCHSIADKIRRKFEAA